MSKISSGTLMSIPFNTIEVDESFNARSSMKGIKELADSISENGLLQPLIVTNGGGDKFPYKLSAGNRRAAALKLLNWGSKEVNVVVRQSDAIVDNIVENGPNGLRQALSPIDLALRCRDMLAGEPPATRKYEKVEMLAKFGLSSSILNSLLRIADNIGGKVRQKARNNDIPLRNLIGWAALKDKAGEPDHDAQMARCDEYIATQEALAAEGRQKAGKKKVKASKDEDGEPEEPSMQTVVKKGKAGEAYVASVFDQLIVMRAKSEQLKGEELHRMEGRIEAVRFLLGETKRMPGLVKADYAILIPAEEPVVEGEEEGEEE